MAYPCTHQRRRLLKRQPIRQQDRRLRVRHHVLGKSTVVVESRSLAVLAIPRVQPSQLPFREAAPGALGTGALVIEHAHTAANLPFAGIAFRADVYDDAGWLVRGNYGQLGPELAIEDL